MFHTPAHKQTPPATDTFRRQAEDWSEWLKRKKAAPEKGQTPQEKNPPQTPDRSYSQLTEVAPLGTQRNWGL